MIDIFGTLGPSCADEEKLYRMFKCGMNGIRLNLSHTSLKDFKEWLDIFNRAAEKAEVKPKILIDMMGPEVRIKTLDKPLELKKDMSVSLGRDIPVDSIIFSSLIKGDNVLLDDGKIRLEVVDVKENEADCKVLCDGILNSKKSLAIECKEIPMPTLTENDLENLKVAKEYGVTGMMQPFVRNSQDLITIKNTLKELNIEDLRLYAKIENRNGVEHLEELLPYCDEIVIARGDLGNAVPLSELPMVSFQIQNCCKNHNKPYMVVTQMLDSMIKNPVPTRAEVSDIFYNVYHGASSIMLTGETAAGKYPVEAVDMFVKTAKNAYFCREK